jgi:hypothetical protein
MNKSLKCFEKYIAPFLENGIPLALPEGVSADSIYCVIAKRRKVGDHYEIVSICTPFKVKVKNTTCPEPVYWPEGEYQLCVYEETKLSQPAHRFTVKEVRDV